MDKNDKRNQSGGVFAPSTDQFAVRSATSAVSFATCDLQPGVGCYVGVDDRLLIQWITSGVQDGVIVNIRIMRPDGLIIPFQFITPRTGSYAYNSVTEQLCEGYILSASMTSQLFTAASSSVYAVLSLVRQPNTVAAQYELLASGYLSVNFPIGFPSGVPTRQIDGPGRVASVTVANPVAGADWAYTVPASARQRIITANATLATAVAVANRNVDLIIDDGLNVVAEIPSGFSQAASLTDEYTWMDSAPGGALFDNLVALPLPGNLLLAGNFRVRTETTALQAADQWSAITLLIVDWIDAG